jgi:hypothetical protein
MIDLPIQVRNESGVSARPVTSTNKQILNSFRNRYREIVEIHLWWLAPSL